MAFVDIYAYLRVVWIGDLEDGEEPGWDIWADWVANYDSAMAPHLVVSIHRLEIEAS